MASIMTVEDGRARAREVFLEEECKEDEECKGQAHPTQDSFNKMRNRMLGLLYSRMTKRLVVVCLCAKLLVTGCVALVHFHLADSLSHAFKLELQVIIYLLLVALLLVFTLGSCGFLGPPYVGGERPEQTDEAKASGEATAAGAAKAAAYTEQAV
eukprot:TRINITY_DN35878_c0_g1_i1.p1 TRINITY_DN35878_c0_g1~~TRINITY_DN35878_c0_g1_i1.p1  ORF type:complete len:155 (-),score=29.55 TRINITY_DN35878_c0_g1_i1:125-589(-)